MPRLFLIVALALSLGTSPFLPWAGTLYDAASGDVGSQWDPDGELTDVGGQWDPDGDELPEVGSKWDPNGGEHSDVGGLWDPNG